MKQWDMGLKIEDNRIRFFIGDVRDKDRLHRALDGGLCNTCSCNQDCSHC